MASLTRKRVGELVGDAGIFQHVSPQVMFALPTGHDLNPQGSGTCRWPGKVTDHSFNSKFYSNERSQAFCSFDGTNARFPVTDDCILLELLPSCTDILDICVRKSVAGGEHRFLDASTNAVGSFTDGFDAANAPTTSERSILECAVPVAGAMTDFPDVEIYIGRVTSPLATIGDAGSFQSILAVDVNGNVNPAIALLDDTEGNEEQYVLYAKVLGDVPANSFLQVHGKVEKAARF